jgi:hypothetical protein
MTLFSFPTDCPSRASESVRDLGNIWGDISISTYFYMRKSSFTKKLTTDATTHTPAII